MSPYSEDPAEIDPHRPGVPNRAHSLVAAVDADTDEDLARELERMAEGIRRGEVTVGVSGSPWAGAIYSYRVRPEQTHDAYFTAVNIWLQNREGAT